MNDCTGFFQNEINLYMTWVGIIAALVIIIPTVANIWIFSSLFKEKIVEVKNEQKIINSKMKEIESILKQATEVLDENNKKFEGIMLAVYETNVMRNLSEARLIINATGDLNKALEYVLEAKEKAKKSDRMMELVIIYEKEIKAKLDEMNNK